MIIQSDHLKFQIFSRSTGVDWSLIIKTVFTIHSTKDLKSKDHMPVRGYEEKSRYARFRFLVAKILTYKWNFIIIAFLFTL